MSEHCSVVNRADMVSSLWELMGKVQEDSVSLRRSRECPGHAAERKTLVMKYLKYSGVHTVWEGRERVRYLNSWVHNQAGNVASGNPSTRKAVVEEPQSKLAC